MTRSSTSLSSPVPSSLSCHALSTNSSLLLADSTHCIDMLTAEDLVWNFTLQPVSKISACLAYNGPQTCPLAFDQGEGMRVYVRQERGEGGGINEEGGRCCEECGVAVGGWLLLCGARCQRGQKAALAPRDTQPAAGNERRFDQTRVGESSRRKAAGAC